MGLADDFRGMFHGLLRTSPPSVEANVHAEQPPEGRMALVEVSKTGTADITLDDELTADDLKAVAAVLRRMANFVSHQSSVKRWAERHDIKEID